MLKKIAVKQVRPGMHIHEPCGPWINHRFWRIKLIVTDPADLRRPMESGITELWIDSAKGLDVEAGKTREPVDGSGYPHRLKDPAISLFAKVGAVCNVYDALTSNRPYKQGWDPAESIKKVAEWRSGYFDQKVFAGLRRVPRHISDRCPGPPAFSEAAGRKRGPVVPQLCGKKSWAEKMRPDGASRTCTNSGR